LSQKAGKKLAEVIKKAIDDSSITMAEYEEIMSVASRMPLSITMRKLF